jgi:hypothetical protein
MVAEKYYNAVVHSFLFILSLNTVHNTINCIKLLIIHEYNLQFERSFFN